jgi:hypothetical protein
MYGFGSFSGGWDACSGRKAGLVFFDKRLLAHLLQAILDDDLNRQ